MVLDEKNLIIGILIILVAVLVGMLFLVTAKHYLTTKEIIICCAAFICPAVLGLIIYGWNYAISK